MGSFLSKCCNTKKKEKQNKPKENGHAIGQPEHNENSGKILLNDGNTIDPRDVNFAVPTEDTRRDKDVKQPETEKKKQPETNKKKKRNKNDSSSDSSSGWSSSSSDSPAGYSKNSRKVNRDKNGGMTIVNKSVKIMGAVTKISNVENVTLNINSGPVARPRRQSNRSAQNPPNSKAKTNDTAHHKERFTSYHTSDTLRQEMLALKTDTISNPTGFFTSNHTSFEDYHTLSKILSMAGSVCKVVFPGGFATGFRVGINKLLVTNHSKDDMLRGEYKNFAKPQRYENSQFEPFTREGVYAVFNHDSANRDPVKFTFLPKVYFIDYDTDIAILELKPNGQAFPEPFEYFSIPKSEFVFIGHHNGENKKVESVKKVIRTDYPATRNEIAELRRWSLDKYRRPYDDEEYADCLSIHRHLFKSKMENGCSGSPGLVVVDGKHVAVVTVFLHKCPDWLFNPDVPQEQKNAVPESYCVSQGANMFSLYTKMLDCDEELCHEIFKHW